MKIRGHVPNGAGEMVEIEIDLTVFVEAMEAVKASMDRLSVSIAEYGDGLSRLAAAMQAAGALPERRQRPRTGRRYSVDPRDVQAALEARGFWC